MIARASTSTTPPAPAAAAGWLCFASSIPNHLSTFNTPIAQTLPRDATTTNPILSKIMHTIPSYHINLRHNTSSAPPLALRPASTKTPVHAQSKKLQTFAPKSAQQQQSLNTSFYSLQQLSSPWVVDFGKCIWATITPLTFARLLLRLQNRSSEVSIVVLMQLQIRSFGVSIVAIVLTNF
jgi:hypothetical protein